VTGPVTVSVRALLLEELDEPSGLVVLELLWVVLVTGLGSPVIVTFLIEIELGVLVTVVVVFEGGF
jgi:hypothetical protein